MPAQLSTALKFCEPPINELRFIAVGDDALASDNTMQRAKRICRSRFDQKTAKAA